MLLNVNNFCKNSIFLTCGQLDLLPWKLARFWPFTFISVRAKITLPCSLKISCSPWFPFYLSSNHDKNEPGPWKRHVDLENCAFPPRQPKHTRPLFSGIVSPEPCAQGWGEDTCRFSQAPAALGCSCSLGLPIMLQLGHAFADCSLES